MFRLNTLAIRALGRAATAGPSEMAGPSEISIDARLYRVREACGELCNLSRPIAPPRHDEPFGCARAHVDCAALFADGTGIDANAPGKAVPRAIPSRWLPEFTMHGRIPLVTGSASFYDREPERNRGERLAPSSGRLPSTKETIAWSAAEINRSLARSIYVPYRARGAMKRAFRALAGKQSFRGQQFLVVGSHTPWVEALLLRNGALHVTTLEFARIRTIHPSLTPLTPDEFLRAWRAGALTLFDGVVSFSSVESRSLSTGVARGSEAASQPSCPARSSHLLKCAHSSASPLVRCPQAFRAGALHGRVEPLGRRARHCTLLVRRAPPGVAPTRRPLRRRPARVQRAALVRAPAVSAPRHQLAAPPRARWRATLWRRRVQSDGVCVPANEWDVQGGKWSYR